VLLSQDKNGSSVGSTEQVEKISNVSSSETDSSDGSINIAIECAMNGNAERFVQCFDNESDPYHDAVATLINTRSEKDNRSALDWAALTGNVTMVSELIKHGADINAVSEKGRFHSCRLMSFSALVTFVMHDLHCICHH